MEFGALALLGLVLFGWAFGLHFLKGKWSFDFFARFRFGCFFAYFDSAVVTYKIWPGLLGVIMVAWGLPFNNRKGDAVQ